MSSPSLNEKLVYIGFQLAGISRPTNSDGFIDLERTLHAAALEIPKDSRLLSLLCSWVSVHGDRVIVEKLMRLQKKTEAPWLSAISQVALNLGYHKWKRLVRKQKAETFLIDRDLALSGIRLKGEETGMRKLNFLTPKGSIRIREKDALSIRELAKINRQYRNRLIFGAAIRSDIITAIEQGIPTPYSIAKAIGCSYEPAHRVFNEYKLVQDLKSS